MSDAGDGAGPNWLYEPETPKRKHRWNKPTAGFVKRNPNVWVAKCPNTMTNSEAEDLINDGIPWIPTRWRRGHPQRIYVVHDGVIYRAMPTRPGVSYHGFPEHPDEFRKLPPQLRDDILDRAHDLGCKDEVLRWLTQ